MFYLILKLLIMTRQFCDRSLGCIAYEIHMGHPPFKTVSILHLIRLLKTQDVTFPSQVSETYKDLVKGN
jgi:hypothetical protein